MALWPQMNRWLVWFHRWSGVALFLLVVAWFASGVVLLYVPFPSLPESDRLEHSEVIDSNRLVRTPAEALGQVPGAVQLVLISVAGHATYIASQVSGPPAVISGDDRPVSLPLSPRTAQTVAEHFAETSAIRVDGPLEYDQWIVHQRFDPFRPFYRVRIGDSDATDLYVSARTGQVLQRTRSAERGWNWAGAVLHWIYFTPLRKSWPAWNQTVWWLSLITLLTSLMGVWLGFDRLIKSRRGARTAWSPYRGWMKWHHIAGLFSSGIVLIWIFSGWLSMDHGRLFSMGHATQDAVSRFRGSPLQSVVAAVPTDFLQRTAPAAEIHFDAVAGKPFMASLGSRARSGRVLWLDNSHEPPAKSIDGSVLMSGLRAAWPDAGLIQSVGSHPDFYAVAESLGPSAVGYTIGTSNPLRVYVDSDTGNLLVVMDASRRTYAWVYYALHTFNFPALIDRPTLRQTFVLLLMLVGMAFSATGAVLGIKRLRRSFAR